MIQLNSSVVSPQMAGEGGGGGMGNDSVNCEPEGPSPPRLDYYPWIVSPPSLVFLCACICANGTIFIFVFMSKTYRSPANFLLANLCLASTIYITNMIIFTMEKEQNILTYGKYLCIIVSVAHRFPLPLMTLTIMTLSLDRSRIARNPLFHPSKSSVVLQILFVWSVSLLLMIPRAMISSYDPKTTGPYKCVKTLLLNSQLAQLVYAILNLGAIFLLPASVLIVEWRKTWRLMKYLKACQIEQGKSFSRRLRLMRNACIFTCIFLTCWLPMGLVQFPLESPVASSFKWLIGTRDFFRNVVLIQVCINPILLYILSFDFQEFLTSCFS